MQGKSGEPEPVYRVTLQATGSDVPAVVRLRRFLKMALRGYGLRCLDVEEVNPPPRPAAPSHAHNLTLPAAAPYHQAHE